MFKRILLGLVVLLVALVAIAFVLPRQVHVERATTVSAPPEAVFNLINDFRRFNEWSPWAERDPNADYTFTGAPSGQGAKMAWSSDNPQVGKGSQEIIESVENQKVRTALDFGDQGIAEAAFVLEPSGSNTTVTWSFDTDLGLNPIARYMGLMFDGWIGADYEAGLANLKRVAEAQQ